MIGADPLDWTHLAQVAEEVGFDAASVSDHVVYPSYLESKYPYTPDGVPQFSPEEHWPDVWVAISAMAAVTSRLRFMTNIYVLPLRNPFVVAKAVGSVVLPERRTGRPGHRSWLDARGVRTPGAAVQPPWQANG